MDEKLSMIISCCTIIRFLRVHIQRTKHTQRTQRTRRTSKQTRRRDYCNSLVDFTARQLQEVHLVILGDPKRSKFTMEAQSINLTYIKDGSVEISSFYHNETILDLRKRFGEEQGHDHKDVFLYHTIFRLADEKLVRELAETQEGISFNFADSTVVQWDSSKESEEIQEIWAKMDGKWIALYKNESEGLEVGSFWGRILTGGYGEITIFRSGYVFMYL